MRELDMAQWLSLGQELEVLQLEPHREAQLSLEAREALYAARALREASEEAEAEAEAEAQAKAEAGAEAEAETEAKAEAVAGAVLFLSPATTR